MHNTLRCQMFATWLDLGIGDRDIAGYAASDVVVAAAGAVGLTRDDFQALDETPGIFTVNGRRYHDDGSVWHMVLRQARNDPTNDLFNVLRDDKWGFLSPLERCGVCGQPDNCGDCDHTPLSPEQERVLLG